MTFCPLCNVTPYQQWRVGAWLFTLFLPSTQVETFVRGLDLETLESALKVNTAWHLGAQMTGGEHMGLGPVLI